MERQAYVVTGATGNVGQVLAQLLLEQGKTVRVIGRSEQRLQPLVALGAEAFVGSLEDTEFLKRAFQDALAVFAMIPATFTETGFREYQHRVSDATAVAVAEAGVPYVITLSSIGAHLEEGAGVITGLHDQEQRFNQLEGVNVLHLRPSFFMENLLQNVDLIKKMGIAGSALEADRAVPMIATKDIAAYAARRFDELNFSGTSVQELLGPRDITMTEATKAIGKAIGKDDLPYVQFSYEDVRGELLAAGLSTSAADDLIDLYRGANEGRVAQTETRSAENTTPTTIEDYATDFAAAYHAGEGKSEAQQA